MLRIAPSHHARIVRFSVCFTSPALAASNCWEECFLRVEEIIVLVFHHQGLRSGQLREASGMTVETIAEH